MSEKTSKKASSLNKLWRKFYKGSSFQLILSLSFTAVSVTGMLCLGLALFFRFYSFSNNSTLENNQRILEQVNLNLNSYLSQMMDVSDALYYNVLKSSNLLNEDIKDHFNLLYSSYSDKVVSFSLFSEDGKLLYGYPYGELKNSVNAKSTPWFEKAMDRTENFHFSSPYVQNLFFDPDYSYHWVVSLSRYVKFNSEGSSSQGVLLVDMSYAGIEEICSEINLPNNGYVYLTDGDGEIIYHPKQQLIYADLASENNYEIASFDDGSHEDNFNGDKRQIVVKTVGYTGWKLVAVTPTTYFGTSSNELLFFSLFVVLFSVFSMILVNTHLSEKISNPIKALDSAVKKIEKTRGLMEDNIHGPYEIERLSHSITSMVSTLHYLMEDIIEQEQQKRKSELEVLHSQINPHFLYNTLDSVVRMVEMKRNEEAVTMVTALARLFRISLSRGENIITIKDELDHAFYYLSIQKMRFKDKFSGEINCSDEVSKLYTTKLIVQPILENAIYHGMAYADGDGEIQINAFIENDMVIIDVCDNGPGMREDIVEKLLDPRHIGPHTKGSGIGLQNVHQRIKLTFGEEYGLTIFSEPDEGTRVKISIPIINETDISKFRKEKSS